MTAKALRQWLEQMGWNADIGAKALGISRSTVYAYLNATASIPLAIQLACRALLAESEQPPPSQAVSEPPGSMDPIYAPFPNAVPKMSSNR